MLDTNICSYVMKTHPPEVLKHFDRMVNEGHQLVISTITYAEMRFGAIGKKANPKLPEMIDEFINRLDGVVPLDRSSVEEAYEIRRHLSMKGQQIGLNDSLIAGNAKASSCILVTNNEKEFSRVPNLIVENWISP